MLVQRIKTFIRQIDSFKAIAKHDRVFKKTFLRMFAFCLTDPDHKKLEPVHLQWLQKILDWRFEQLAITNDYTATIDGINKYCNELAHDLAPEVGKTWLQILMPTIKNTTDPILFEKHEDFSNFLELRAFFLGGINDKETIYRMKGLFKHMVNTNSFSIFDDKEASVRPFSVLELARISVKVFELPATVYNSFWDYLKDQYLPDLDKKGDVPREFLPKLLEIIKLFFDERNANHDQSKFSIELLLWCKSLLVDPLDAAIGDKDAAMRHVNNVNCLYGQKLWVAGKGVYLIEVLIDLVIKDSPANRLANIKGLARWLCEYDASFIVDKCPELDDTYIRCRVGIGYKLQQFHADLVELSKQDCSNSIKTQLTTLIGEVKEKLNQGRTRIYADLLEKLKNIYREREKELQINGPDYLESQEGTNAPWINLAAHLDGARYMYEGEYCRYIVGNYYGWLMKLRFTKDAITQNSLTTYPLSHYIRSESGNDDTGHCLILLDCCTRYYDETGVFKNRSEDRPFTTLEIQRMHKANSRFHRLIPFASSCDDANEPSIKFETWLAIKKLVEKTAHSNLSQEYAWIEPVAEFIAFRRDLPAEERQKLDAQTITYHGRGYIKTITAQELFISLEDMQTERDRNDATWDCMQVCGLYLAQLVVDYFRCTFTNNSSLERGSEVEAMRAHSRNKSFSDIDDAEMMRRIQMLVVFLLTHKFVSGFLGGLFTRHYSISVGRFTNTVNKLGNEIYDVCQPLVNSKSNTVDQARNVYVKLMELVKHKWLNANTEAKNKDLWLGTIADGTMFTRDMTWFEPMLLIKVLPKITQESLSANLVSNQEDLFTFADDLEDFCTELAQVYLQPLSTSQKSIIINIKFMGLVDSLNKNPEICRQLWVLLKNEKVAPTTESNFCREFVNFIINRLAHKASLQRNTSPVNFFGQKSKYETVSQKLSEVTICSEIDSLIKVFEDLYKIVTNNGWLACMEYLGDLLHQNQNPEDRWTTPSPYKLEF